MPILQKLIDQWPEEHRFGVELVSCFQALGRISEARTLLEAVFECKKTSALKAQEEMQAFQAKHQDKAPEDYTEPELRKIRDFRTKAAYNPYAMAYLMGSLLFAEGDEEQALSHLKRAEQADPSRPDLHLKLGTVYLKMKRWADAENCFNRALDLDPDNALGYRGLCESYLPRRRNAEAAEAALASVGLLFHNPRGHFLLGVALHRLGELPRALEALTVAVSQNPNFPEAHRRLAYIYRRRLGRLREADAHLRLAREATERIRNLKRGETLAGSTEPEKEPSPTFGKSGTGTSGGIFPEGEPVGTDAVDLKKSIVIVTGLPRSGTSMMMQMLQAGGLPLLMDHQRPADVDNPRGYFEYEPVKRLHRDAAWLPGAAGKGVKIMAQLLGQLRPDLTCRVIFMTRNMEEVLQSQAVMLERQGRKGADLADKPLSRVFSAQARQARDLLAARGIPFQVVDYGEAVKDPYSAARGVNRFLGGGLDEVAMAETVDPKFKRQGV